MTPSLITTADGSHSLYLSEVKEPYHSINGALQESTHVFINAGFLHVIERCLHRPVHVLEIGFGTGLNAWLTLLESEKNNIITCYETIEKYPLSKKITEQLNYATLLPSPEHCKFAALHEAEWEQNISITSLFTLHKKNVDLQSYVPNKYFDVIYFDAFAFDVQPYLWTETMFQKMYDCLQNNGILVTYSSKGVVKNALRNAGFIVERMCGAVGKRHMVRGKKMFKV